MGPDAVPTLERAGIPGTRQPSKHAPGRSALTVLLVLTACLVPKDRGQRPDERIDRPESEAQARPPSDARAAQDQAARIDARLAEMQKQIDVLEQPRPAESSGREESLAQEVSRLRAAIDAFGRRLDAVEHSVAQHTATGEPSRARAVRRSPEAKAAPPAPAIPAPLSSAPAAPAKDKAAGSDTASYLALARTQESKGQTAVARDMYEEFLKKYPTDPQAADVRFRLGELAFAERRYQDATLEFGKVARDFPRSDKAPDALLQTAESMVKLDLVTEAKTVLADVPKRYPRTRAATRATQRLAEIKSASETK